MELTECIMRDGFRVLKRSFVVPENTSQLDPQAKRRDDYLQPIRESPVGTIRRCSLA